MQSQDTDDPLLSCAADNSAAPHDALPYYHLLLFNLYTTNQLIPCHLLPLRLINLRLRSTFINRPDLQFTASTTSHDHSSPSQSTTRYVPATSSLPQHTPKMVHQREAKRPYGGSQPHISSYFPIQPQSQTQPSSQPTYSISTPQTTTTSPSLPHTVQSNLLSVGMRVRKSVPEGYKTSSEYSAFNLFTNTSTTINTSTSKSLPTTPFSSSPPSQKTRPRANAGARELQPFCGLLKVGGLNTQQAWGIYSPTHEEVEWERYDCHAVDREQLLGGSETPEEDDVPVLSQGSSNADTPVRRRGKRRCEWDDGEEEEDEDEENVFRLPRGFGREEKGRERVLALPRGRKGMGKGGLGKAGAGGVVGDVDFEEAEFLDYDGLVPEVEMGGV